MVFRLPPAPHYQPLRTPPGKSADRHDDLTATPRTSRLLPALTCTRLVEAAGRGAYGTSSICADRYGGVARIGSDRSTVAGPGNSNPVAARKIAVSGNAIEDATVGPDRDNRTLRDRQKSPQKTPDGTITAAAIAKPRRRFRMLAATATAA